MDRKATVFTPAELKAVTERNTWRVDHILRQAKKLSEDASKAERLSAQFCKQCFYSEGIAGQAFTSQPCACCHRPQIYPSTNTDALCAACATAHSLCKHCSGDIEMNPARSKWPAAVKP